MQGKEPGLKSPESRKSPKDCKNFAEFRDLLDGWKNKGGVIDDTGMVDDAQLESAGEFARQAVLTLDEEKIRGLLAREENSSLAQLPETLGLRDTAIRLLKEKLKMFL
jgi:hypothetical protein